jgi:DNA end-binding protein Ku
MQQLLYADEVRPISDVEIQEAPVKEPELKLAIQLIDQISAEEFNPKNYEDDVKKRIETAVQEKVQGQEISVSPAVPAGGGAQVIDLMEALRASVGKAGAKRAEPAEAEPPAAERRPPKRAAAAQSTGKARVKAGRR